MVEYKIAEAFPYKILRRKVIHMKKKLLITALIVGLILSFAACGPKADPNSDFEYVKKNGKIIVGYTDYAPMNYFEGGKFTGFDTELAIAVCAKLGVTPDFVEIDWGTKEVELNAKSIDCIWNGLTITEERKANMSITNPYVQNAQVVVVKAGSDYANTASLIGKTVCAETGSAGEGVIEEDDNLMQANYVTKNLMTECLLEVKAGTADAAVLDLTLAKVMTGPGTDYADLIIVDRLEVEDYGIAFRKGSDLCDKVNTILKDLKTDGTLGALAEKYGLDLSK
jgi:polar amino acid transport system substrate-binding protein